jgi:hypothetical protein
MPAIPVMDICLNTVRKLLAVRKAGERYVKNTIINNKSTTMGNLLDFIRLLKKDFISVYSPEAKARITD